MFRRLLVVDRGCDGRRQVGTVEARAIPRHFSVKRPWFLVAGMPLAAIDEVSEMRESDIYLVKPHQDTLFDDLVGRT